jgi:hypothetical protein
VQWDCELKKNSLYWLAQDVFFWRHGYIRAKDKRHSQRHPCRLGIPFLQPAAYRSRGNRLSKTMYTRGRTLPLQADGTAAARTRVQVECVDSPATGGSASGVSAHSLAPISGMQGPQRPLPSCCCSIGMVRLADMLPYNSFFFHASACNMPTCTYCTCQIKGARDRAGNT